jgi:Flp pilus assembly protein TadB
MVLVEFKVHQASNSIVFFAPSNFDQSAHPLLSQHRMCLIVSVANQQQSAGNAVNLLWSCHLSMITTTTISMIQSATLLFAITAVSVATVNYCYSCAVFLQASFSDHSTFDSI